MMKLRLKGLSVLIFFVVILFVLASFVSLPDRTWIQRMVAVAGAEGILGFLLMSMAMERSDRFFYSAFAGGMLSRLSILGLFATLLSRAPSSATYPLLTLVLTYFICSLLQMPFLWGPVHGLHRDFRASSS